MLCVLPQDVLLVGLAACLPSVTAFNLASTELNTQQLTALMSHFPALTFLDLSGATNFDDLTCTESALYDCSSLANSVYKKRENDLDSIRSE